MVQSSGVHIPGYVATDWATAPTTLSGLATVQIFTFIGFLEVCHRRSRTAAALSRPAPERRRPTRRPALCGLPHPSRTAPAR